MRARTAAATFPVLPLVLSFVIIWRVAYVGTVVLSRVVAWAWKAYKGRSHAGAHSRYYLRAAGRRRRVVRLTAAVKTARSWTVV